MNFTRLALFLSIVCIVILRVSAAQCKLEQYQGIDGECYSCEQTISGCVRCKISQKQIECLLCKTENQLIHGNCLFREISQCSEGEYYDKDFKDCKKCDQKIQYCASCISIDAEKSANQSINCSSCYNGLLPYNQSGQCLCGGNVTCSNIQTCFQSQCQNCSDLIPNCSICSQLNGQSLEIQCQACNKGYNLSQGKCVSSACNPKCQRYFSCKEGKCESCQNIDKNCQSCKFDDGKSICLSCFSGYQLQRTQYKNDNFPICSCQGKICKEDEFCRNNCYFTDCCYSCTINGCSNCSFVSGDLGCNSCKQGYYLQYKSTCSTCSSKIQDCQYCYLNNTVLKCTECRGSYFLVNNSCLQCPDIISNCKQCNYVNDSINCLQCYDSYALANNSCIECSKKIRNCSYCNYVNETFNCTNCNYGYRIIEGGCWCGKLSQSCDQGEICFNNQCEKCSQKIQYCTSCLQNRSGQISCNKCEDGYRQQYQGQDGCLCSDDRSKVLQCSQQTNTFCSKLIPNCSSCYLKSDNNQVYCIECKNNAKSNQYSCDCSQIGCSSSSDVCHNNACQSCSSAFANCQLCSSNSCIRCQEGYKQGYNSCEKINKDIENQITIGYYVLASIAVVILLVYCLLKCFRKKKPNDYSFEQNNQNSAVRALNRNQISVNQSEW